MNCYPTVPALGTCLWRSFVSSRRIFAVLALASGLLGASALAQEAATGTITGRVLNAQNGKYLPNARVTIEGTTIETFTNDFGEYTLRNVPAGDVTVRATFTGQTAQTATVTVAGDETATHNVQFGTPKAVREDGAIVLDEFTVETNRFRNAQEIAINEERYSVNIKNVVSTDSFGDIPNGNIGEFVKFLPGVQISYGSFGGNNQGYSDTDASGISVRGFGPEDTAILIDGMPVSNATPGTMSRQVGLDMLAINNASRVELIKVATPDMPANSPGGQVNLITKSAFEYAKPQYTSKIFFNFNSEHATLDKTPGPVNKETYKVTPGVELGVIYPLTPKLGLSVTGFWNQEFNQTYRAEPGITYTGSVTNAEGEVVSLGNPIFSRFKVTDTPRKTERISGNIKLDWKPTPSQTLSGNIQYSTYDSVEAQRRLDARPSIGNGVDWGPTFTNGTTANSTLDMTVTTRDKIGDTISGQLQYRFDRGGWRVFAGGSLSVSEGEFADRENGHYSEVALKLNPGRVTFNDIQDGIPGSISTFQRTTAGGGPLDYTDLSNYGFDGTIAKSGEASSRNTVGLYKLDVERDLDFIPFLSSNLLTLKVGARRDEEKTEKWGRGTNYREILGPGKSYLVADILDDTYLGQSPGFGLPPQQWASTYKLYQLNQENQLFVVPEDGEDAVQNWLSYQGQQKSLTETTDAWYGMLAGRFFKNRLALVGGMRQERKSREGRSPFTDGKWDWAKLPDGSLYSDDIYRAGVRFTQSNFRRTNPDGTTTNVNNFLSDPALLARMSAAGVKFPDHLYGPANTSVESAMLNRVANRYVSDTVTADPSYSLSAAYELTKKIQLKAAWSRSLKLPPIEDGVSGLVSGGNQFTINENPPDQIPADGTLGTIRVANPGVKPALSNNWDFEVSYYTDNGGKFSVSYYTKDVENQIMTFTTYSGSPEFAAVLGALGLNPEDYIDWKLDTSTNSNSSQKTDGWEYEVRQDFGFLGGWGKHFQAFASYTMKSLADAPEVEPVTVTAPDGSTITLTPTLKTITQSANRFAGAGLQFSSRRLSAQIRGTYRNDNEVARTALANGNFLRQFQPAETRIDVSLNYRLTKHWGVFLTGRDVFNGERKQIIRDDAGLLPTYAELYDLRDFGVQWTVGATATF